MAGATRRDERRARRTLRRMARAGRRAARRSSARPVGFVLLAAVVMVGAGLLGSSTGWDALGWLQAPTYIEVDGEPVAIPRPEPAEGRLRPAVPVTTEGDHAFLHADAAGNAVGYDPCRPVRYVINPAGMPASGQALIDEAVAVVSAATGLVFEYVGSSDEAPAVARTLIQPDRYGDVWAPVLIAWSDEASIPELAGEVAGMGGSAAVPGADGEGQWLAAGRMVLDVADVTAMLARPDGHAQARAIVVHELSHVLGLDHVQDPTELMHPVSSARTDLGPGDRQGLALVGQATCE